jgi:hypothetical protein
VARDGTPLFLSLIDGVQEGDAMSTIWAFLTAVLSGNWSQAEALIAIWEQQHCEPINRR